ncbi:MAG TPA: ABC transporter ATP-binding protein [Candidatus Angelobacter sp.]|nr:ABC transporter ATP-binding protein [Candidatus Angelobacter sp.]
MSESNHVVARLERVTKKFGNVTALKDVDLAIPEGRILGLLGPNGAGKTTAVRLLLGMMRPNHGRVTVFGGDPRNAGVRVRVGAMLQVGKVPETLRVREHIQLFSSYYPQPLQYAETLALAGLESVAGRLFGELSGGQKQRVLFALALCGNPDLIVLDEPTVGMDVEARHGLWDRVRDLVSRGKTIILTTHYLEEADALSDRIVVINNGCVIANGAPGEIKSSIGGKLIRCTTALGADDVRRFAGVLQVRENRGKLEIRTSNPDDVVRTLLSRDPGLSGIEITSTSLDEAFLALTRPQTNPAARKEEVYQ